MALTWKFYFCRKIDTEKFSGILKLDSGDKITLPYEHFSKKNKA